MNHQPVIPTTSPAEPPITSQIRSNELMWSFFMVVVLSGVYIAYELLAEPRGSHPFGHTVGIIGTLLMVMTEVLYSLRKRTRLLNRAGPLRHWLSLHIFTGIVGPFMVLMHTGLAFRGLAGISMLLTTVVVASGFIGRYFYTALPRAVSGAAASRQETIRDAKRVQAALEQFQQRKPVRVRQAIAQLSRRRRERHPLLSVLGRSFYQWQFRLRLRRALRRLDQLGEGQRRQLGALLDRKRELDIQIEILETARRMLRYWHIFHIPIGLTLFFSVAVHVAATIYFRAGLFQ